MVNQSIKREHHGADSQHMTSRRRTLALQSLGAHGLQYWMGLGITAKTCWHRCPNELIKGVVNGAGQRCINNETEMPQPLEYQCLRELVEQCVHHVALYGPLSKSTHRHDQYCTVEVALPALTLLIVSVGLP